MMESLNRQIDAKFDAAFNGDNATWSEGKIREIATEEAENVVDGASIHISA